MAASTHSSLATSPVTVSTLLELEKHVAGTSRYHGRIHVNLTSDRFLTITRSTDEWAKSVISIVDLGTPDLPVKVTRFDVFLNTYGLYAEVAKCAVDPTGKYCVIYDLQNVWISKESTKPLELGEMKKVEMNLGLERIQRVVWNGPQSVLILTNTKIATIKVSLDGQTSFIGEVYAIDGLTNPYKCETTPAKEWAICTALPDSATLQEDASGALKKVVFLKLSNLEVPQLSLTTSSGTIHVTDSESTAVAARAGQQKFSTLVSFFALEGEQQGQLKFQEEFQCQRDHDLSMTDIPIAIHVIEKHQVIFIVTKLSYIHVCLLKNGKYVGSTRISRFKITASILRSDKSGIILTDANGTIHQALSQPPSKYLPLPAGLSRSVVDKITTLREIIHKEQSEVSKNQQFFFSGAKKEFFDIFPDFITANGEAYRSACEVTEHLTAEELLLLYGYFLKHGIGLMQRILMLAKKHLDRTGMDDTLAIVKKHGGLKGSFSLLNLVGTPNLDSKWLVKYLEAAISLQQYNAVDRALFAGKISDPVSAKNVLRKSAECIPEVATIYVTFCVGFGYLEDLVKHYLTQYSFPEIKELIEKQSVQGVLRIFLALRGSTVPDALFDAYVDLLKEPNFTQDFLDIFAEEERMKTLRRKMLNLVAEHADERLTSLLLTSYDKEASYDQLIGNLGKLPKEQSERVGKVFEKTDPHLALIFYAKGNCPEALFKMVRAGTDRIGELSRYLLKSADVDLWRNTTANPHVLVDGLTAGNVILDQCLADLIKQWSENSETVETLTKNDCALWFFLFDPLKRVYPHFAPQFIATLLKLGEKYENKEKVLKQLEDDLLEIVCLFPGDDVHVLACYLKQCRRYNPLAVFNMALMYGKTQYGLFLVKEMRTKFAGTAGRFTFEITDQDVRLIKDWISGYKGKNQLIICFAADILLQKYYLEEAVGLYISVSYSDNYQNVMTAVKQQANFDNWDLAASYYEMVAKTVKDPMVKAALSIAYVKANREEEAEKLLSQRQSSTTEMLQCIICEEVPRAIRFEPCGHLVTCIHCAPKLTVCPICRQVITRADRTYV